MVGMAAPDMIEQQRLRRRSGDPRISEAGRAIISEITAGDLAYEFQAALDADLVADPPLGGQAGLD